MPYFCGAGNRGIETVRKTGISSRNSIFEKWDAVGYTYFVIGMI